MLRILLVDDTPNGVFEVRSVLQQTGYDIVDVAVAEALPSAVSSKLPDVIVVDTHVPSHEIFDRLRAITEQCARPLVMFSRDARGDYLPSPLGRRVGDEGGL